MITHKNDNYDIEIPIKYKDQVCRYNSCIPCIYCYQDDYLQYIQCKKEYELLISLDIVDIFNNS